MPVVSMQELLGRACRGRYAVPAFNIFNDLSMQAVLDAAAAERSPVIVQVSVKTVRRASPRLLAAMFAELAKACSAPATLHLDHCPDRAVIEDCLRAGWNSVLFDASALSYEENLRQTREVVEFARPFGAAVEGDLEAIQGVEDGHGSDEQGGVVALDKAVAFIEATGIDCFAPAIGTAHGLYKHSPKVNFARVEEIFRASQIPIVVHGGTGLSVETFHGLIDRGAAKINVSTQLKITYLDSIRTYLAGKPDAADPMPLFESSREELRRMAASFIHTFRCGGQAA